MTNRVLFVERSGELRVPVSYTHLDVYKRQTNVWTVYDGSSWVGANSKYIAYYLDPRNFLNETDIFQFESLSFSKVQTRPVSYTHLWQDRSARKKEITGLPCLCLDLW